MRRALAVLAPLAVILLVAVWREAGPAPLPATADPGLFSAGRAVPLLGELLGGSDPHPLGSPANAAIRDRVAGRFHALGYETTVQRRFVCNARAVCATVENVVARHPGPQRGDAVVVAAHYDSVGAGPGASDDGMGVAALLKIARAVRNETFRNPVVFLADDGEEAGLLGAEAFLADSSLSANVATVINIENRGTWGASNMFETSGGNRWLVRHLAGALKTPHASSLFYAIYKLLPNDTDVTVFKREGRAAVNFAAIRSPGTYHTPLDDLAHASPRTMQHHGQNALSTLRALARADLGARGPSDATYFDLLGFTLVWWPQEWTVWMIAGSLALLIVGARREPGREMTWGVLACFGAIALGAVSGAGVSWVTRLRSDGIAWVAHPHPAIAALWAAGAASAIYAAAAAARRARPLAMIYGAAIVWHMIAGALAFTIPGAAYLFLVPATAVALSSLFRFGETATGAIATAVAVILWSPLLLVFYDALGGPMASVLALATALILTLSSSLFGRGWAHAAAGVAVACALIGAALPAWNARSPRTISISWLDDAAERSPLWLVPRLSPQMLAVAPFAEAPGALVPWSRAELWSAPAERSDVPRVTLSGERGAGRVTLRVRSAPGSVRMVLLLKGATRVASVNGTPVPPATARRASSLADGWRYASAAGVEEMTAVVDAGPVLEVVASDLRAGLPASGAKLAAARDATPAVPIHDGDLTITRVRARF